MGVTTMYDLRLPFDTFRRVMDEDDGLIPFELDW